MVLDEVFYFGGHGCDGGVCSYIADDDVFQMPHFVDDGRDDEVAPACQNANNEQQGDDDAESAEFYLASVLYEADNRVEQVGNQPCYEKGNEGAAEAAYQEVGGAYDDYADENAYKTVECDGSAFHNLVVC